MTLDRNKTVWQRLNARLREVVDQAEADKLTKHLHPYVIEERKDAVPT